MSESTLDPKPNQNVRDDKRNKGVSNALDVITKNYNVKNERDSQNLDIQRLFEKGFEVRNPKGTKKINSKRVFQAIWRMASRMKPLDFVIHGNNRPRDIERIVTDGVATVMKEGGYIGGLRDKQGAFFNLLMYGDAWMYVGANPDEGFPIVFNPISNSNIFVDQFAVGMRDKGWGRNATKMVAIFSYSWAEFVSMFPKMKTKAGIGRIPRTDAQRREIEDKEISQNSRESADLIEVAYSYDIVNKNFTIFAGASCTVIEEFNGDDYPFIKDKKPYIPILHFLCTPSSEGFYNYGIGNMIYDLALVSQRMLNMEIAHIEDNTYPVEIVNVPQGEASKFFNKLALAHEMRAQGKKGYVAMEQDATNSNGVSSQSLVTQNLFNEWNAVFDRLDRELARMGIFLDEADRGADVTATQILAEEEAQNAFIKQVQEYNATESNFAVDLSMDFIKRFVGKKDKTPLNLSTKIEIEGQEERVDGITLGMVAEELKEHHYWSRVNARSGAYPSNVLRSAQISRALQLAAPGSPAYTKLISEFAGVHDIDIPGQEFMPQQEAPQADLEAATAPQATGTDRIQPNARSSQEAPIL